MVLLNDLGNGYQLNGERSLAEAQYRAALALDPRLPEVWNNLGNLLSRSDLPSERAAATEAYQNALRLQPEFPPPMPTSPFLAANRRSWRGLSDFSEGDCPQSAAQC